MEKITIPVSPARHAAQMGLILGGYLSLMFVCVMYSIYFPLLSLLALVLLLGVPFVAYRLGRSFRNLFPPNAPYPFILAWSHSAQMFLFGGIVLLLPAYYYFTQELPRQIPIMEGIFAQMYKQSPEIKTMLRELYGKDPMDLFRELIDRDGLWLRIWSTYSSTVFWGAMVSLINALFLKRKAK